MRVSSASWNPCTSTSAASNSRLSTMQPRKPCSSLSTAPSASGRLSCGLCRRWLEAAYSTDDFEKRVCLDPADPIECSGRFRIRKRLAFVGKRHENVWADLYCSESDHV